MLRLEKVFLVMKSGYFTESDKWDFIKIRNLSTLEDTTKRIKEQATYWEKHISDEGLIFRMYKELSKFDNKKTNQFLKWVNIWKWTLLKRERCIQISPWKDVPDCNLLEVVN